MSDYKEYWKELLTPEQFAEKIKECLDSKPDRVMLSFAAFDIITGTLQLLGYGKGATMFRESFSIRRIEKDYREKRKEAAFQ